MTQNLNRRQFLVGTGAGALATGYFTSSNLANTFTSPNERLNIAAVGASHRAGADISGVSTENIVAIADVDSNLLDRGAKGYPAARKYRDFRKMLEAEEDKIDAVVVGTPDHTHAPAAAMALRMGKHVYCEKPLTHTVFETRQLRELALEKNLVTQMGTQIHSLDNYRRVVELVRAGVIGKIRDAHVWSAARYCGAHFTTGTPAPKNLNWDLWLGPAQQRPYSEGVHPSKWRGFWEYGSGALGDFGCHYMDLAHWALKLTAPIRISAQGPPVNPVSTPEWLIVKYEYPARGEQPPVNLTWYDSGKQPEILSTLKLNNGQAFNSGQLFIGDKGMILSDYNRYHLLPKDKFADVKPDLSIAKSIGHHAEWVHAVKNNGTTTCNFEYSGALTEAVLLGTVAYRSGKSLAWDSKNFKITNEPEVQDLLHIEYRKGWTL